MLRSLRTPFAVAASALVGVALCAPVTTAQTPLTTEVVTSNVVRPVLAIGAPGDSNRLFVVEQHQADIEIFIDGVKNGVPFFDFTGNVATGNEQGLLSLAFHPNYNVNGYFFVHYSNTGGGATKIVRYARTNADAANMGSAVELMTVGQPQSNHNGGRIAFSPIDGFLYIGLGDGGNANDSGSGHAAGGNAQSMSTRLGKILRINPSTAAVPAPAFTVPASNPFIGGGFPATEVWALGVRNPWNFSFDSGNGDLYIGDVGQDDFQAAGREEISFQDVTSTGGENYGWRCTEGNFNTGLSGCTFGDPGLTGPIFDYEWGGANNEGQTVTGGEVYRGDAIADLRGTYFFADYITEELWSFRESGGSVTELDQGRETEMDPPGANFGAITNISTGPDGELYISQHGGGGQILKIVGDTDWVGLGCGTNGTFGEPILWGSGSAPGAGAGSINLDNARTSAVALMLVSLSESATPAFGGTLKPTVPWNVEVVLNTGATGEVNLPYGVLSPLPSGTEIVVQTLIADPAHFTGVAMSTALKATVP